MQLFNIYFIDPLLIATTAAYWAITNSPVWHQAASQLSLFCSLLNFHIPLIKKLLKFFGYTVACFATALTAYKVHIYLPLCFGFK